MEMNENSYGMMDLHYAMVMLGGGGGGNGGGINPFGSDSTMGMGSATSGLSGDSGSGGVGGGSGGLDMEVGGRWSKEETLALLDIRAKLDSKFKAANHKGHLWDEVSMIMCGEHGYKRSGKKCSEKFENLYKYYKKIKEGKAGRQDKKHYRFFHQLEAICGETSANANANSVANTTSPPFLEDGYHPKMEGTLAKKRWKAKITDFIETKMNTIMEKQDKWMEKMMNTIEEKEKERISKEKQWRKEEAARLEREKTFRLHERARMMSREAALMEALHKLTKNESTIDASCSKHCNDQDQIVTGWGENETAQLIELRNSMETRFEKGGCMEDVLWEEIAITMASLGYNRSALICKAKWDHINFLWRNKKQKGCSNSSYDHHDPNFHQVGERFVTFNDQQIRDGGNRVFMSDPHEMMWNYYGKTKENI
ncbi:putative transcription factor MYB family [Helianthus annuus]|uniref:Putative SANT/Myb domain-containing protein n=1 Tax=Helianthus annuus TaxID=4232 RepID=A0A251TF77_HELAN|nr:trihelix transcription factor PTL [Helianthus annuus]KAF5784173.1 putative transcription factor MYB family [Helianthus annuus]KAJ0519355.1 putative transcription factor MYB family [Helianthus annuus]KAJ0687357.1 putative transcription factor MYB family [Helianthus annuus]KAJ0872826.1 putative transcription factor MYB family [Helianthus annuus]KAJ0877237.1 putative transcription factor MYB family [Helianthus annuus]